MSMNVLLNLSKAVPEVTYVIDRLPLSAAKMIECAADEVVGSTL